MGISDLEELISSMQPILNEGEYIFATLKNLESVPREITICEFKEAEGTTVVVSKADAIKLGLDFEYVASWITLNVHSSLAAVGLTAAFSKALSEHGISCNVIAAYYHDHIFVDKKDEARALKVLQDMSK